MLASIHGISLIYFVINAIGFTLSSKDDFNKFKEDNWFKWPRIG